MSDLYAEDKALAEEAADAAVVHTFEHLVDDDWTVIETLALAVSLVLAVLLCTGALPV